METLGTDPNPGPDNGVTPGELLPSLRLLSHQQSGRNDKVPALGLLRAKMEVKDAQGLSPAPESTVPSSRGGFLQV